MEPWRTAIVKTDESHIWYRGHDVTSLMKQSTYADIVYLLHRGTFPSQNEGKLLNAILIATADHSSGAPSCATARLVASGNRQSLSAAIAGGILAIGDEHAGAGAALMEIIAAGIERSERESISIAESAERAVSESRASRRRLPGFGHRVHTRDPRTGALFSLAHETGLAGNGVAFVEALEKAIAEQVKPLPTNVDGAMAGVLYDLGFPPSFGKLAFIIGRVAGLTAEVVEEYTREKVMRVRIPVEYDGEPPQPME